MNNKDPRKQTPEKQAPQYNPQTNPQNNQQQSWNNRQYYSQYSHPHQHSNYSHPNYPVNRHPQQYQQQQYHQQYQHQYQHQQYRQEPMPPHYQHPYTNRHPNNSDIQYQPYNYEQFSAYQNYPAYYNQQQQYPMPPQNLNNLSNQISPSKSINKPQQQDKTKNMSNNSNRPYEHSVQKPRYQNQNSEQNQQEEQSDYDEQQVYYRTKTITKNKDPVMDTPDQIRKWIEARRKNYPQPNSDKKMTQQQQMHHQLSILEKKIRKKIILSSSDPRNLLKKIKNMDILRRIIIGNKVRLPAQNITKSNKGRLRRRKVKDILNKCQQNANHNKMRTKQMQEQKNQANQQYQHQKQQLDNKNIRKEQTIEKQDTIQIQQSAFGQKQSSQQALQVPICKQPIKNNIQLQPNNIATNNQLERKQRQFNNNRSEHHHHSALTPEVMIKHLQQKQQQDHQYYSKILDYRANSLNYKYAAKVLETNFVLDDVFQESSYLLQALRYIVNQGFFMKEGQSQLKCKNDQEKLKQ